MQTGDSEEMIHKIDFPIDIYERVGGFINNKGELKIFFTEYDMHNDLWEISEGNRFSNGLVSTQVVNGRWGYLNKDGEWAIEPIYDAGSDFSEGIARVQVDNRIRYIDVKGNTIYEHEMQNRLQIFRNPFFNGRAIIKDKENWKIIDSRGNVLKSLHGYDSVSDLRDGFAIINVKGKFGFINQDGDQIVSPVFEDVNDFSDGMACVSVRGKGSYINSTGAIEFETQYDFDDCGDFCAGMARIYGPLRSGYINKNGELIIPRVFLEAGDFSEEFQVASVQLDDDTSAYIDKKGNIISEPSLVQQSFLSDDAYPVFDGKRWKIFSLTGTQIEVPNVELIEDFHEGLAVVKKDGKYGYINKFGEIIVEPYLQFASRYFYDGMAYVRLKGIHKRDTHVSNYDWKVDDHPRLILEKLQNNPTCHILSNQFISKTKDYYINKDFYLDVEMILFSSQNTVEINANEAMPGERADFIKGYFHNFLDVFLKLLQKKGIIDYDRITEARISLWIYLRNFLSEFFQVELEKLVGVNPATVAKGRVDEWILEQLEGFSTIKTEEMICMLIYSFNLQNQFSKYYDCIEMKRVEMSNDRKLDNFEKYLFEVESVEQVTIDDIDLMSGYEFEGYICLLFQKMGYDAEVTKLSGDQGVDVIAISRTGRIGIQAKRYTKPISNKAVQEIVAGLKLYKLNLGIVVTNNTFTPSAYELAKANNIELWNRETLMGKIIEYPIDKNKL